MRIGCSECLCIAIESHRPALLKSLLQRADVVYRDIYWAPAPHWTNVIDWYMMQYPLLHDVGPDTDLSLVGREDCGHMRVDVELDSATFDLLREERAYILVSLPQVARWHSSERFDAERILRQCGQFDYSEPQLYDIWISEGYRHPPGPLNLSSFKCVCEFEYRHRSRSVSINEFGIVLQPSTLSCNMSTVCARTMFSRDIMFVDIYVYYGQLSNFINNSYLLRDISDVKVLEKVQALLNAGGDLNPLIHSPQLCNDCWNWEKKKFSGMFYHSNLLQSWYQKCSMLQSVDHPFFNPNDSDDHFYSVDARDVHRAAVFLLRNGVSFFYGAPVSDRDSGWDLNYSSLRDLRLNKLSLLRPLLFRLSDRYVPFVGGVARQLLALGYGRRELHPAPLPLQDENLHDMRLALARLSPPLRPRELLLKSLVEEFRAWPLSLQQLARIAIRRAVGGAAFSRQVKRLAVADPLTGIMPLPPLLLRYVVDPTELMLSDEEAFHRMKSDAVNY